MTKFYSRFVFLCSVIFLPVLCFSEESVPSIEELRAECEKMRSQDESSPEAKKRIYASRDCDALAKQVHKIITMNKK